MRISDAEMGRLLSDPEHLMERAWQWSDAEVDMRFAGRDQVAALVKTLKVLRTNEAYAFAAFIEEQLAQLQNELPPAIRHRL